MDLPIDLERAVATFVAGFTAAGSTSHPYLAERVEGVWVTRDAPRTSGVYRREEYLAHGVAPAELDRVARAHTRGHFCLCPIRGLDEAEAPIAEAYRALGYSFGGAEPLMVHPLARVPCVESPFRIERVRTRDLADRLAADKGSKPSDDATLSADARHRWFVALDGDAIVGRACSIAVPGQGTTWLHDVHVAPSHRRRGIARAMLAALLRDDRERGSTASVLTSSQAGAGLYPSVGYEPIGEVLIFKAKRPE